MKLTMSFDMRTPDFGAEPVTLAWDSLHLIENEVLPRLASEEPGLHPLDGRG
jgi:hypothetical protein